MHTPEISRDGWCLEDGEERNRSAPETFEIPAEPIRRGLQPGDYAKLIFRIAVESEADPETVERMWVVVRERTPSGYMGVLDNDPDAIEENDELWSGTELPFEPRHVIAWQAGDEASRVVAQAEPRRRWA